MGGNPLSGIPEGAAEEGSAAAKESNCSRKDMDVRKMSGKALFSLRLGSHDSQHYFSA